MILINGCSRERIEPSQKGSFPVPRTEFSPETYVCYRTDTPVDVDGRIDEFTWLDAAWTDYFVDIEGDRRPEPKFQTRVKMLWDSKYYYVAAEMEEPHVWAILTQRDAVIFYDNDFEIFIDPDGDTHEYYELEINALNTVWDLLLVKPYRDGGPAIDAWDIQGLKTAVTIDGTLNQPGDTDYGWSVEIAMPWEVLKQCAHKGCPPQNGDQWRVNFSRVEWQTEVVDEKYHKLSDPTTGKVLPEDNWVWSPQGLINMHYPEMWGFVQFTDKLSGSEEVQFTWNPVENAKWTLRLIYYAERNYLERFGRYTENAWRLGLEDPESQIYSWPPEIQPTPSLFEATVTLLQTGESIHISQDGHIW
jgi:hypothetical protein